MRNRTKLRLGALGAFVAGAGAALAHAPWVAAGLIVLGFIMVGLSSAV